MRQLQIQLGILILLLASTASGRDTFLLYQVREVNGPVSAPDHTESELQQLRTSLSNRGMSEADAKEHIESTKRGREMIQNGFSRRGELRVFLLNPVMVTARSWENSPEEAQIMEAVGPTTYAMFTGRHEKGMGLIARHRPEMTTAEKMPYPWLGYTVGHPLSRAFLGGLSIEEAIAEAGRPQVMADGHVVPPSTFDIEKNANGQPARIRWTAGDKISEIVATIDSWTTVEGRTVAQEFTLKGYGIERQFILKRHSGDATTVQTEWDNVAPIRMQTHDSRKPGEHMAPFSGSIESVRSLEGVTRPDEKFVYSAVGAFMGVALVIALLTLGRSLVQRKETPDVA
jgi:hypothetical protein